MFQYTRHNERVVYLILVTKQEAMELRKAFPDTHVARTCKQHPRKSHYYATETPAVMKRLAMIRGRNVSWSTTDKFDGYNVTE